MYRRRFVDEVGRSRRPECVAYHCDDIDREELPDILRRVDFYPRAAEEFDLDFGRLLEIGPEEVELGEVYHRPLRCMSRSVSRRTTHNMAGVSYFRLWCGLHCFHWATGAKFGLVVMIRVECVSILMMMDRIYGIAERPVGELEKS